MLRRPDLSVIDNLKPVKSLLIVIFSGKPSPELGTFRVDGVTRSFQFYFVQKLYHEGWIFDIRADGVTVFTVSQMDAFSNAILVSYDLIKFFC